LESAGTIRAGLRQRFAAMRRTWHAPVDKRGTRCYTRPVHEGKPREDMRIPQFWRLQHEHYMLSGQVCERCGNKIVSRRKTCPLCCAKPAVAQLPARESEESPVPT
jgi:hypothetical protein